MGHSSQTGQVIFATQTAPKVPVPAGDLETDGLSVKIRSGSLGGNRDLLTADPEIGGGRDTADAYLGTVGFSGDYDMYVRYRAIGLFLKNVLGAATTTPDTPVAGANTHVITPVDGQVPFMTVYEEISDGLERFIYSDVVVNTLSLEAEANGFLTATVGLIGRLVTPGVAAIDGAPLTDNTAMTVGTNIQVTYAGVSLPAKSMSISISNNFEDDNFYLGSFFLGDLTAQAREVSGSVTLRHEDASYMRQSLYGTPTATTIGGITTKEPLVISAASYEDIPGATGTQYSLELEFGKVIFEPFAFEPSGADALESDVAMRMVRPDPTQPIMKATLVNGDATIA